MTFQPQPGDVGLSGSLAQGVVSLAIKLGSVLRHEPDAGRLGTAMFVGLPLAILISAVLADARVWLCVAVTFAAIALAVVLIVLLAAFYGFRSKNKAWFSHSFIVHHVDPDGTVWITEALSRGVVTQKLHYARGDYVWLRTSTTLTGDDAEQMRTFLDDVVGARTRYDYRTFAGLAVYCITGAFLVPQRIGTALCSGVTSEAVAKGWIRWPLTPYRMMPQDQHTFALANGIEIVPT